MTSNTAPAAPAVIVRPAGEEVAAVSRAISAADVPDGVRPYPADLTAPDSLGAAFDGGSTLFLMFTGGGAYQVDVRAILEVAKARGIQRAVLLSSQGVVSRPESPSHGRLMRSIEEAVEQSGLDSTVLRPGGFASNASAWAQSTRAIAPGSVTIKYSDAYRC